MVATKPKKRINAKNSFVIIFLMPPLPGAPIPGRITTRRPIPFPRGATRFGRTGSKSARINRWRRLGHLRRLRGRRKARGRRRWGQGRGPRAILIFQCQLGFRILLGAKIFRIQWGREPYQMLTRNPIPRGGQGAVKVEISGRRLIPSGHGAIFLPKLRGIGFFYGHTYPRRKWAAPKRVSRAHNMRKSHMSPVEPVRL